MSELAREGVTALAVPLHGAREAVHDWVAGEEGSFSACLDTMDAARNHGLSLAAWTSMTRSNARVLGELPTLLKARGVALWIVEVPRARDGGFTAVVARFGLSIPSALAALTRARGLGIEARLRGAPLCTLGRFAAHVAPSEARSYGAVCAGCPARGECPGADELYLTTFGERELRAVRPTARAPGGPLLDVFGARPTEPL